MLERIHYIDKLKGLAILFVVMGHVSDFGLGINDTLFNSFYISFHMPLFMYLSGLFAFSSDRINISKIKSYLFKRLRRLLCPFFFVGILYSIISKGNMYGHLLGDPGRLWFLPALFYVTLAAIVWMAFNSKWNKKTSWFSYGIEFVFFILVLGTMILFYDTCRNIPYLLHAIKMFPFFMLGVFCNKHKCLAEHVKSNNLLYSSSIIFYLSFLFLQHNNIIPDIFLASGLFAIIILMQLFNKYDNMIPKLLSLIGKYSLEIYLFHFLFLPSISNWDIFLNNKTLMVDNFLFTIVISFIISCPIIFLCIIISIILSHSALLKKIVFG